MSSPVANMRRVPPLVERTPRSDGYFCKITKLLPSSLFSYSLTRTIDTKALLGPEPSSASGSGARVTNWQRRGNHNRQSQDCLGVKSVSSKPSSS